MSNMTQIFVCGLTVHPDTLPMSGFDSLDGKQDFRIQSLTEIIKCCTQTEAFLS
jgi:hypothetical protein